MNVYLIGALVGVGGYILYSAGKSSAGALQAAQAAAQSQAAGTYDAQSASLGMTPGQAQAAFDQGLTPSEGAGWSGALAGGAAGGAAAALATAAMTAGPLTFHGEVEPSTGAPVYRNDRGQPILVDELGDTWTFSEAA